MVRGRNTGDLLTDYLGIWPTRPGVFSVVCIVFVTAKVYYLCVFSMLWREGASIGPSCAPTVVSIESNRLEHTPWDYQLASSSHNVVLGNQCIVRSSCNLFDPCLHMSYTFLTRHSARLSMLWTVGRGYPRTRWAGLYDGARQVPSMLCTVLSMLRDLCRATRRHRHPR